MLRGKKILVGVTGSIAAYKAAFLVRLLIKAEAEVKVILTTSASEFITPLTLATLSKNPVLQHLVKNDAGEWNNHVDLGMWADALVIAPASANTLAKFCHGLCDSLLTAVYLSARCPVFLAPAMDLDMYVHPATKNNLDILRKHGNSIIDAEEGELASGLSGYGRMAEPEHIMAHLENFFCKASTMRGKKILITAGPTFEAIDPVRFIGNHSSGKMGFAIADAIAKRGGSVTLVSGPSTQKTNASGIDRINVTSADEMFAVCQQHASEVDIIIMAAAVADYKPAEIAASKLKKKDQIFSLDLIKTVDIAATLGAKKKLNQLMVGFALETDQEEENATSKLKAKNFDLIVLNSLNDQGAGFGHDTNQVTFIDKHNNITKSELKDKQSIADDLVEIIFKMTNA